MPPTITRVSKVDPDTGYRYTIEVFESAKNGAFSD